MHRKGKRSIDRNEEEANLKGEQRGEEPNLTAGKRDGEREGWREIDRQGEREGGREDSGILVKVSSLCIACCAIPPL